MNKKEILEREKGKMIEALTMLEIDIGVLEKSPPDLIISKQKITEKSYREVSCKEMLERLRRDKEGNSLRLSVIESLLKYNEN